MGGLEMIVEEIKVSQTQNHIIKKLIDLAGFNTVTNQFCVILTDKKNPNADKYSDLTFKTLYEAAKAIEPYICNQFRFVA